MGGVLSVCRDGQEWPVAFHSRLLRPPEKNYSASEIECLAIVDTVRHFETHLLGRRFLLETDHQALQFLQSKRSPNKRLTRWALFLQEFAFEGMLMACLVKLGSQMKLLQFQTCRGRHRIWRREMWGIAPHELLYYVSTFISFLSP